MFERLKNAILIFFRALKSPKEMEKFLLLNEKLEKKETKSDPSHLQLLKLLQERGRLIDFFMEDVQDFTDAQIGSVVRQIHADCAQSLEEFVCIKPILDVAEGAEYTLVEGYDLSSFKVVGNVVGSPPYKGKVMHQGWVAHKKTLPQVSQTPSSILAPAEIEVE